ncbi:MAG: DNA-directed RNA polymerase subunit alpha C-terminal domain-containing protein [Planctomycetaceae bacterium]
MTVAEVLEAPPPLTNSQVELLREAISGPQIVELRAKVRELEQVVSGAEGEPEDKLVKIGVCLYLLADHVEADRYLKHVKIASVGLYHHALVLTALNRHDEAAARFSEAASKGFDEIDCTLRQAGSIRATGKIDEAEQVLRSIAASAASRAEYSFQMGCIWADRGDALTAIEYFERAVDMDPHHSRALFWLASENALRGNDEEAIRLYEQSLSKPPHYTGAILNLGLLYEDQENYKAAAYCFKKVLDVDPNNGRARLYLRDIEATQDMYYDEDSARQEARMKQLLGRPVTDFELSVRSRNCLENMNIMSLGDLTEVSEQELLAGKNFGETSLTEIRELLSAHNLSIGQHLHKVHAREPVFEQNLSPEEQALMNTTVGELNLSVRARKCMTRLGISTIGALLQRTPDELLSSRNFGVTSLNEIRARLAEMNLKLRND